MPLGNLAVNTRNSWLKHFGALDIGGNHVSDPISSIVWASTRISIKLASVCQIEILSGLAVDFGKCSLRKSLLTISVLQLLFVICNFRA